MTLKLAVMVDVIGIDHLYISVPDMNVSGAFYDRVMIETLGFRKKQFELAATRTSSTSIGISASC